LLSIQSLLSSNPYTLEPGFDARGADTMNIEAYNAKVIQIPGCAFMRLLTIYRSDTRTYDWQSSPL
jgi:hypothetical protein